MGLFLAKAVTGLSAVGHQLFTTTTTPDYIDVSWVEEIADVIPDVLEVLSTPPINIFIGAGLIGLVAGLIRRFMH